MTLNATVAQPSDNTDDCSNTLSLSANRATLEVDQIQKPKLINNFASIAPSDDFQEISRAKISERNSEQR